MLLRGTAARRPLDHDPQTDRNFALRAARDGEGTTNRGGDVQGTRSEVEGPGLRPLPRRYAGELLTERTVSHISRNPASLNCASVGKPESR